MTQAPIVGEKQAGDILAYNKYAPMTQIVNGRFYKRPLTIGERMWVDPAHVADRPDLWSPAPEADPYFGPSREEVMAMLAEAVG